MLYFAKVVKPISAGYLLHINDVPYFRELGQIPGLPLLRYRVRKTPQRNLGMPGITVTTPPLSAARRDRMPNKTRNWLWLTVQISANQQFQDGR